MYLFRSGFKPSHGALQRGAAAKIPLRSENYYLRKKKKKREREGSRLRGSGRGEKSAMYWCENMC